MPAPTREDFTEIFIYPLPTKQSDLKEWIPKMTAAINLVARIPGIDPHVLNDLNQRMEDIVDKSNQGKKNTALSKAMSLTFRLRHLIGLHYFPETMGTTKEEWYGRERNGTNG